METFSTLLALCDGNPLVTAMWIPLTKASDTDLWCILWSVPAQTAEQTMEMPVVWDAIALIRTSLMYLGVKNMLFLTAGPV